MDHNDDFNSDAFFNDSSLQQIDPNGALDTTGLDALNTVPLPANPAVVEHILNLNFCGSLHNVAWSRQGHVASRSDDGTEIHLQCLYFDSNSSSWLLTPKHVVRTGSDSITTLVWSPTGGDLAVADTQGRLSILQTNPTAMNRASEVRQGMLDEPDEFGRVIGMSWLGQDRADRPKSVVLHATKGDTRWANSQGKANPLGPLWQRAVVLVNRKGHFSLYYQRANLGYGRVSISLSQSPDSLYTHAAFSPTTEGKLLVVLHSYDSTLSVCNVQLDFTDARQAVEGSVGLSVELVASSLSSAAGGSLMNGDVYDPDSWSLTHLAIIPTTEIEKSDALPPQILAIYSNSNNAANATDAGYLISSVVRRWSVSQVEEKLHPRFVDLPTKTNDATNTLTYSVRRQPDKDDQVITSATLIDNGQSIIVTTQDGRTDFLGTDDLSSLAYRAAVNEVHSLAQSGFGFPMVAIPMGTSLSPNACMQAMHDSQGKLELLSMEFQNIHDQQVLDLTNPTVDAAIAAIVLTFSRACWSNGNIDDLLSCIMHAFPPTIAKSIIISLYRTLFRDTEFVNEKTQGSELEKVVQKPVLTKVLSFHWGIALLGTPHATPSTASLTGQWAWIANNFRFVATLLYLSYREYFNPASVAPQELVEIICGNVRWSLDVLRFITASILDVGDRESNPDMFDPPSRGDAADGSQGLAALLINCHWSRVFMVAIVRAFRMFAKLPEPRSKQQAQIIRTIHQYTTGKGMNMIALEGGLLDARWSGVGDMEGDRGVTAMRQIEMMATGRIDGAYQGSVKRILMRLFNAPGGMREKGQLDRLKLFTDRVDVDWLLLRGESEKGGKGGKKVYDVHKKRFISKGEQEMNGTGQPMIKRCIRCGSYNEDVNGPGRDWPRHINVLVARCVCDGPWIVEPWDKSED